MARKGKQNFDPDKMAPGIAEGLDVDTPVEDALARHEVKGGRDGADVARDFLEAENRSQAFLRDRSVHFVAEVNEDSDLLIHDPNTGRTMRDVAVGLPSGHRAQILAGYRCINCYEAFDQRHILCPVCEYPVSDGQLRAQHEFKEELHVGPSITRQSILDDIDERQLKREWRKKMDERGRHLS